VNNSVNMAQHIADVVARSETVEVIQPAEIGEGKWQNELLLFIKPEVFLVSDSRSSQKTVELILEKLKDFDAHIDGISVVGGKVLEEKEIMNHHYGFINVLSRSASKILHADDKKKIEDALNTSLAEVTILGGHEFLAQHPEETSTDLDHLWFQGKSTKIRSGFYVRLLEKDGQSILLVNGFHPEQLAHFTRPHHKIVLMLVHSNTAWSALRNEMVGVTFPEKAASASIRGTLHAHAHTYGFDAVTIANNCVHLSAGPFEAMFEITNFFGKIMGLDVSRQPPLAMKYMTASGIDDAQAAKTLDNPIISLSGKAIDLFTATEDVNTDEAIELYRRTL